MINAEQKFAGINVFYLILKYKQDIRESEKLLAELGLGTPLMAGIKKKIDDAYSLNGRTVNNNHHSHRDKAFSDLALKRYYDSFSDFE